MTQPLIQQLAARAGFTTPDDITPAECSGYGTTLLLFELCAYLDERAAAPPCCGNEVGPGGEYCCRKQGHEGQCRDAFPDEQTKAKQ